MSMYLLRFHNVLLGHIVGGRACWRILCHREGENRANPKIPDSKRDDLEVFLIEGDVNWLYMYIHPLSRHKAYASFPPPSRLVTLTPHHLTGNLGPAVSSTLDIDDPFPHIMLTVHGYMTQILKVSGFLKAKCVNAY